MTRISRSPRKRSVIDRAIGVDPKRPIMTVRSRDARIMSFARREPYKRRFLSTLGAKRSALTR
jgi:hypothetical protein